LADFQSPIDPGRVESPIGLSAPPNHEGFDLMGRTDETFIRSIAGGTCLFVGDVPYPHWGKMVMFRHRSSDGTELISIYGHLDRLTDLETGRTYDKPVPVGEIVRAAKYQDPYLHFALAYGASWDLCLHNSPVPPANAGNAWIEARYLNPLQLLQDWSTPALRKYEKV
jgi:murein DD-endopeptidase MepM/ murein hydrolase activator NlpD